MTMNKRIADTTTASVMDTEAFCLWLIAMAKDIRSRKKLHPMDWNESQTLQEWLEELPSLVEGNDNV